MWTRWTIGLIAVVCFLTGACSGGSHAAGPTTTDPDQPIAKLTQEACDTSASPVSMITPKLTPDFVVRVHGTPQDFDVVNTRVSTLRTAPAFGTIVDLEHSAIFVEANDRSLSGRTEVLAELRTMISEGRVSADIHSCTN